MHHVAIMKKSWGMIPKILSGEKTIESRWYQTKRVPWDRVHVGDTIFFKNSGEPIIAQAIISKVRQFEVANLDHAREIIGRYGKEICLPNNDPTTWPATPKYCILVHLQNPQPIATPSHINKSGFGAPAAWLTLEDIEKIKITYEK